MKQKKQFTERKKHSRIKKFVLVLIVITSSALEGYLFLKINDEKLSFDLVFL